MSLLLRNVGRSRNAGSSIVLPQNQTNMLAHWQSGHSPSLSTGLEDNGGGDYSDGEVLGQVNSLVNSPTFDLTNISGSPVGTGDPVVMNLVAADTDGASEVGLSASISDTPSEFCIGAVVKAARADIAGTRPIFSVGNESSGSQYFIFGFTDYGGAVDERWSLLLNDGGLHRWSFGDQIAVADTWYAVLLRGTGSAYLLDVMEKDGSWTTDIAATIQTDGGVRSDGDYFDDFSWSSSASGVGIWRNYRTGASSPGFWFGSHWVDTSWCHGALDSLSGHRAYYEDLVNRQT